MTSKASLIYRNMQTMLTVEYIGNEPRLCVKTVDNRNKQLLPY